YGQPRDRDDGEAVNLDGGIAASRDAANPPRDKVAAPRWVLLVGQPVAQWASAAGQDPAWRGAVKVRCVRMNDEPVDAAEDLLGLLRSQMKTGAVRAGLWHGTSYVRFVRVVFGLDAS